MVLRKVHAGTQPRGPCRFAALARGTPVDDGYAPDTTTTQDT